MGGVFREGCGKGGRGGGERGGVPGVCDDDVVEGGVAFAEAGEADSDDHC